MARDYDDDDRGRDRRDRDDDRRRRDDWDDRDVEERYEGRRRGGDRPKSGAVTAVAVINFVLGGLGTACGLFILLGGVLLGAAAGEIAGQARDQGQREAAAAIGGFGGFLAILVIVIAVVMLIMGILMIIAGVGVVQRRNWGRILTLVLGAISGLLAVLSLVQIGQQPANALISLVIYAGYAVLVYVILLNSENAREFT